MNYLFIIDPDNYKGNVQCTMPFVEKNSKNGIDILNGTYVHYTDLTFEQYNKSKGGNLVALTWDEYYEQYYQSFNKSQQGPFKECTKDQFWDALECLPPKRWTQTNDSEFFFLGECFSDDLYDCYLRKGNKYYTALRSIHTKPEDLFNMLDVI